MERMRTRTSSNTRDDDRGSRTDRGRDTRDTRDVRDTRDSRDDGRRSSRGRDDDRGGRKFSYQRRDDTEAKRRAESNGSMYDVYIKEAIKTWKPADKLNTFRILPPTWDNPKHYGLDIWLHYGIGPDRQTYLCLHKMKGEPCPVCEEHAQAVRDGDEDYAKELKPTRRVLVYLIDRDHEKDGLQAWAMPQSLDTNIVQVSVDGRSGEVLALDHPDEGYDISFSKTGAKDRTRYEGTQIARRESPLDNEDALNYAIDHPLPDQLVYFPYDHIRAAFGGGGNFSNSHDRDAQRASNGDPDTTARGGRTERGREPRRDEDELTWDKIHAMTPDELDDLVESKDLKIDVNAAQSDDELADWICEDLDIKKVVVSASSRLDKLRRRD